jgi:hypothetical protein
MNIGVTSENRLKIDSVRGAYAEANIECNIRI